MMILLFVHLCLIWILDGIRDGIMWSRRGADALPFNEHNILTMHRGLILALLAYFVFEWDVRDVAVVILAAWLSFPFFHNGAYYQSRHHIDGAYTSWRDMTKGSSAGINFTLRQRGAMAIAGLVVLIAYLVYKTYINS